MTSKIARQHLICRRPSGDDDSFSSMREAIACAAKDASLGGEFEAQTSFDVACAKDLAAMQLPAEAESQIEDGAQALSARRSGILTHVSNPAILAVGTGIILLIGVLVWNFFGRAGTFPDEAIKIATTGGKVIPADLEVVETKVSHLQDWFMLKGFDRFQIPPGFENFDAVGVRIFKVENEPVGQIAVAENSMWFYSFNPVPFGITIPEKSWRVTEADRTVLALRAEDGVCFMVAFRGKKADMRRLLEKAVLPE